MGGSLAVAFGSVLAAIGFNNQLALDTSKVGNERADCHLASEFETTEPTIPEAVPEASLRVGRIFSQRSRVWIGSADCRHARPRKEQTLTRSPIGESTSPASGRG